MEIDGLIKIPCPYCGIKNCVQAEKNYRPQVFCCDSEIGGCDKYFTYEITPVISFDVKIGKINDSLAIRTEMD